MRFIFHSLYANCERTLSLSIYIILYITNYGDVKA